MPAQKPARQARLACPLAHSVTRRSCATVRSTLLWSLRHPVVDPIGNIRRVEQDSIRIKRCEMSDMKRHGASDKRITEKHEANKHLINPCLCFYNQYRRFVGVSQPRYVLNQMTITIGIPNEIARITKAGTRSLTPTPPLPIGQTLGARPLQ